MKKFTPVAPMIKMRTSNSFTRKAMDLAGWLFKSSRIPCMTRLNPWLDPGKSDIRWLPVNADIKVPGSAPLPVELLDRFIEEASHRVIIDGCACRISQGCKNHSQDIGCLFLGDSALDVSEDVCREASVEEAKEHVRKAVADGLVPFIGKIKLDNAMFGIKDRSKLISVCFCCECCCLTRYTRFMKADDLDGVFHRTEGVTVKVTEACTGCGTCAESCYIEAIEIIDGKAVIGEYCRTCGRCATACPNKAIEISIDDPGFLEEAYSRICEYGSHR